MGTQIPGSNLVAFPSISDSIYRGVAPPDVNNFYVQEGTLTYESLDGWWTDAGTFESLLRANNLVAQSGANKVSADSGVATAARKVNS